MKTILPCKIAVLATFACLSMAPLARATVVTSGHVTAELISEISTIRPGEAFTVGISLKPAPEWHTYWRNPGDSGLPTTVEWKLPAGLRAGDLEWPHPVRLGESPYVTFGYEGDVLLLARIEAPATLAAGSEVELVAATRWLACRDDACVPGRAELSVRVPVAQAAPERDPEWSASFDNARAKIPRTIEGWSATVTESGESLRIDVVAPASARPPAAQIEVFSLAPKQIDASTETSARATDDGYVIEARRDERAAALPDVLGLVLVAGTKGDPDNAESRGDTRAIHGDTLAIHGDTRAIHGDTRAIHIDARRDGAAAPAAPAADAAASAAPAAAPVVAAARPRTDGAASAGTTAPGAPPAAETARNAVADSGTRLVVDGITFWAAVGLAFLGGLILNLMPCVFPVLSLKVLGFIHIAHHDAVAIRRHGYAFAAGVLVSFWILAGALLSLRAAGGVFGWGFQLQEPLFVAAVAALLLAMALNLLGVYQFGSSISGAIGRFDSHDGYRGSFLSGALATVLATPCTAPFMGTALGFAMVQPASESLAVFTALGAGMASPYVVLACVPVLLRRLPRPGAWMDTFRGAMAFPLLATVAWLVWVFGQQTGNDGVLALLIALLLGSAAAWLSGHFPDGRGRTIARPLGALCIAGAAFVIVSTTAPGVSPHTPVAAIADTGGVSWQPWDPDAIARHREEGRVVFVDFTADWCLSCKVNERVALAGDDFADTVRTHSAVTMKADWTRADPRITDALTSFGRSGVPLYVVYPRDPTRAPIILPQILTPALVREALSDAAA